MTLRFSSLPDLLDHGYDTVIDVRSPSEFAEDHIPGAQNLPVLSDAERAEVGTIYVQDSPFLARKIGAAKVFANAAAHIAGPLANHPGGWRPLVYCWRGGQRSGAFRWMLGEIGWRADAIDGGYQSYRRLVNRMLYDTPLPHPLILLDGYTGTAKTALLAHLHARGVQVVDLERLAGHRGSLLGALAHPQPAQKMFESALAQALCGLDPARPVVVEAESSKIGERSLPPAVWQAMKSAPRIMIEADLDARTTYLTQAYDDILSDAAQLRAKLGGLRAVRGHAVIDGWFDLIAAGDKAALTRALITQHYDPAYASARKRTHPQVLATVQAPALDAEALGTVAARIERLVDQVPVANAS